MLRRVCTSLARCDTSRARLKRVLRASTIARMGPTRGAKPRATAEGTAIAAREATMLTTCESVSMSPCLLVLVYLECSESPVCAPTEAAGPRWPGHGAVAAALHGWAASASEPPQCGCVERIMTSGGAVQFYKREIDLLTYLPRGNAALSSRASRCLPRAVKKSSSC